MLGNDGHWNSYKSYSKIFQVIRNSALKKLWFHFKIFAIFKAIIFNLTPCKIQILLMRFWKSWLSTLLMMIERWWSSPQTFQIDTKSDLERTFRDFRGEIVGRFRVSYNIEWFEIDGWKYCSNICFLEKKFRDLSGKNILAY